MGINDRLHNAWNAFRNRDPTNKVEYDGPSNYRNPSMKRLNRGNDRSIVTSLITRLAMDSAAVLIKHCVVDDNGRYLEDKDSGLNNCLTLEANIDQTSREFKMDMFMSLLDEGTVAVMPVETNHNPDRTSSYDILSMRVGKIVEWKPKSVKIRAYDDVSGTMKEVWMLKENVAILSNPLYSIMNEPNSAMRRLSRKLALLDVTDEHIASNKLDLIVQLPYAIKGEARRKEAERRRADLELQLSSSKYGVAYSDSTEKIVQLNRSLENNLLSQVEYLTNQVYGQLGMTPEILNGTADEKTMLNYQNRIIEPIVSAAVDEFKRKFLTKTARTQGQTVMSFSEPFKLVPVNNIAEIADKFTRNEIMTSNEIRQVIGLKPADDPKADQLVNSNISQPNQGMMDERAAGMEEEADIDPEQEMLALDDFDSQLDELEAMLNG